MKFDLTTIEDKQLKKNESFDLEGLIFKKVIDLFSNRDTIKEQRKSAIDIIKLGKKNNVDKLEITLDQNIGIDLQSLLKEIPVKISIGKNGQMKINVKYK